MGILCPFSLTGKPSPPLGPCRTELKLGDVDASPVTLESLGLCGLGLSFYYP